MKIIGVVGWKNTGKTTLIEKLISEFNNRNLTVSTIKHSHHNFSVDREGTDSFRHFNAGTKETILASEQKWIKFSRQREEDMPNLSYLIKQIIPVDIVIVEGFKASDHKKVEVVDSTSDRKPLYKSDRTICGLITNQHKIKNAVLPQFERDEVQEICDFIVIALRI
ncbi:MAG: molybdopterin-guanine dinucleotide biosynthesis protein B [Rhodobacteraceae bacterium]|nr:molybdopterin-guanine dinucleotide biosynthesis protein B [Paracoccaceae bacterium]